MLQHEYNTQLDAERAKRDKRSWTVTIIFGLLAILPAIGIVSVWRHALVDNSLFVTIILPLIGMFLLLGIVALSGRPRDVAEMFRDLPWFF